MLVAWVVNLVPHVEGTFSLPAAWKLHGCSTVTLTLTSN